MQPRIERIDVSTEELEALLEQARPALSEDGYQKLKAAIRTLGYVTGLLEKQETTLASLRELLCPASTEKTEAVLKQAGIETGDKQRKAPKEHGRSAPSSGHGRKVPVEGVRESWRARRLPCQLRPYFSSRSSTAPPRSCFSTSKSSFPSAQASGKSSLRRSIFSATTSADFVSGSAGFSGFIGIPAGAFG